MPARRTREASAGRGAGGDRSPCSFFSVSQNFCSSVKYLSRMNTLERPSVAMAGGAQASHSAAAPLTRGDRSRATPTEYCRRPRRFAPRSPRPSASAYLQAVEPSTVSLVSPFRRVTPLPLEHLSPGCLYIPAVEECGGERVYIRSARNTSLPLKWHSSR